MRLRVRFERFANHVIAPILLGGAVYVLWRTETLVMFRWFEMAGLSDWVSAARRMAANLDSVSFPGWFLYSFPDAAWVYSFSMFIGLLWCDVASPKLVVALMLTGPVLAIAGEAGQAFGAVPGTFDVVDLGLSATAALVAFKIVKKLERC